MSELLQTVIPVVLTALIAGQVAVTRTGRLRKDIRETIDLLGKLPADHPSRETLEVNIGELVDTLVRRQRRRFEPITRAGGWFGVNVTFALLMVAAICWTALQLAGALEPEPLIRQDHQSNLVYYTAFAVVFAGFAVKAWLQQRREHPKVTPRPRLSLSQAQRPPLLPPRDPPPNMGRGDRETRLLTPQT
jgi:hypothetical protein